VGGEYSNQSLFLVLLVEFAFHSFPRMNAFKTYIVQMRLRFVAKPTVKDAELLIQLEKLKFSQPLEEAFTWFSRELADAPKISASEFIGKYPKGSDGYRYAQRIAQFYETMGTMAKHRLINIDVLFDRFGVAPFWDKLAMQTEQMRKEHPEAGPVLGENFEWLAKENGAWLKRHLSRLKKGRT